VFKRIDTQTTAMSSQTSQDSKVFISYSWDSEDHQNSVLDLADSLRTHGIDCYIDRFEGSPSQGWQSWMRSQIEQADFVLTICTEQYEKSFKGKDNLDTGEAVIWKGAIINQLICDQTSRSKFIPIIFSRQAGNHIPTELRKFTYYLLDSSNLDLADKEYHSLCNRLTSQSRNQEVLETVAPLASLPRYQIDSPIQDQEIQHQKLTKYYQQIRRFCRTRSWNQVIAIFQQMQADNLPYFDPEGFYRLSRQEILKEEQQNRQVSNIYFQGKKHYQEQDWLAAREKFQEILRFGCRDKDLQTKVEQKLSQIQKKIEQKKQIAIGLIAFSWLLSSFFPIGITKVLGGLGSAIIIWYMSQAKRPTEASQQVVKLLSFLFIGIIVEVTIWKIIESLFKAQFISTFVPVLGFILGTTISIKMMYWKSSLLN
jgi:hypothetical protein